MTASVSTHREAGAALIAVLGIVAVLAASSLVLIEPITNALTRTRGAETRDQAYVYALGAEDFARVVLEAAFREQPERLSAERLQAAGVFRFPIEGGIIEGQIFDAGLCFNLNTLSGGTVTDASGETRDPVEKLEGMLEWLQLPGVSAAGFAARVADWVDDDNQARPSGAESMLYERGSTPHRAANRPFEDVSEIALLMPDMPETFEALRTVVCALPTSAQPPVNVNLAQRAHAPVLSVVLDLGIGPERLERVLAERPAGGWTSKEAFFEHSTFADIDPARWPLDRIDIRSRYFDFRVRVQHYGALWLMTTRLHLDDTGQVSRLWRRFDRPW